MFEGTNEERKSTREIIITDVLTQKIDYLLCECTIFPPFEVQALDLGLFLQGLDSTVQYIDNYQSEKYHQNLFSYSVDRNLSNG